LPSRVSIITQKSLGMPTEKKKKREMDRLGKVLFIVRSEPGRGPEWGCWALPLASEEKKGR